MKKAAVLLSLFAGAVACGQDNPARWVVLKTNPFWPLHGKYGLFSLAAEVRVAPRLSLQQEVGYLYDDYLDAGRARPNRMAFNHVFRTELRNYGRSKGLSGFYNGVQLMFRQHNYQAYENRCGDEPCNFVQRDDYRIRRTTYGAYATSGYQCFLRKRISFDVSAALGAVRIANRVLDKEQPSRGPSSIGDDGPRSGLGGLIDAFSVDPTENGTRIAPSFRVLFTAGVWLR
ncbi:MAG TPA: DUF3575 domain-containing protein [Cytophagales bacterium]